MAGQGVIVSVHIAPVGAAPMKSVTTVQAVVGKGLEGDRYYNKVATYSNLPASGRDVTLIEIEAIEGLKRDYEVQLEPGQSRRNIVTRGIALNHLVEQEFRIGDVVLRGTRLCEPCAHMEKLTVKGALRGLIHRGGLRVEVVKGGTIRVGDAIESKQ
ncbi:MAG TPA: MOSC domain-containing protein [Candidatus Binatia bacterium]|nr:MOSC domain-containing protein [Candidatus Binatia bacterium]